MTRKLAFTPASLDALQKGLQSDPLTPDLAIEVLSSGKKRWRYRRQVADKPVIATLFGGLYPAISIAVARDWARGLNEQIEAGIDPRAALREENERASITVAKAHKLYMSPIREGARLARNGRKSPAPSGTSSRYLSGTSTLSSVRGISAR